MKKKPPKRARIAFNDVDLAERRLIAQQRSERGCPGDPQLTRGLALSGGGIRSASFCLGVLQALYNYEEWTEIDYLSTVSGGGYIGASLTWFQYLARGAPSRFPFGHKGIVFRETRGTGPSNLPADKTAFVRQHADYLTPSRTISFPGLLGAVLRVLTITFSVYFALLLASVLVCIRFYPRTMERLSGGWLTQTWIKSTAGHFLPAACFLALFLLLSVAFALLTGTVSSLKANNRFLYWLRIQGQRLLGYLLTLTLAAAVAGAVDPIVSSITNVWQSVMGALPTAVGVAGTIWEFTKQAKPRLHSVTPKLNALVTGIAAVAMIFGLLVLADVVAQNIPRSSDHSSAFSIWLGALLAYAVIVGGLMNSNLFGLHRMYRDRLMETFLPDLEAVEKREWMRACSADIAFMQDVCTARDVGPYHILNTNVVLTDSDSAYYRGRGGDNFIFSSLFCGSEATGWCPTEKFDGGKMSLATAAAISGAAVNPNAGCAGQGPTRNPFASFLLSLFGVRLGYWVPNPHPQHWLGRLSRHLWPNLLVPGLRQGLFGTGLDLRAGFVQLTDGGHFDNTGIYELVRRRLDCIILALASADEEYGFDDLADVIERVRADFGVRIEVPTEFSACIPGSAAPGVGIALGLKLCKASYGAGTVKYPQSGQLAPKVGSLIVLKAAMTQDLPIDALRYAATHRDFPNESTADQFFDERQFEAYREAGYAACRDMIRGGAHRHCLRAPA